MKLLINPTSRNIHDASDTGAWEAPPSLTVVEVPGSVEGDANATPPVPPYVWPNGFPSACLLQPDNVTIVANPDWNEDDAWSLQFEETKNLKALVQWVRLELNEVRSKLAPPLPAITVAEMKSEIIAIRKQLGP